MKANCLLLRMMVLVCVLLCMPIVSAAAALPAVEVIRNHRHVFACSGAEIASSIVRLLIEAGARVRHRSIAQALSRKRRDSENCSTREQRDDGSVEHKCLRTSKLHTARHASSCERGNAFAVCLLTHVFDAGIWSLGAQMRNMS